MLGEAIFLFSPVSRTEGSGSQSVSRRWAPVLVAAQLDVLGTMNSADRSIAILDLAVRRRFAFVPLWPQLEVVTRESGPKLAEAFQDLLTLFVDHATDDAFPLMPGHSYFLGNDAAADMLLSTGVRPLLEEYLAQGHVAGFADEVRAYVDRIRPRD